MAGYLGTKAVLLSTTAADVVGNAEIGGSLTVGGAFTSQGIDDNASATAMTLDASGNVGIGTSSPSFASGGGLEINGGGDQGRLAIKNNNTGSGSTDGFQIAVGTDSSVFIEQRENTFMGFSTNATERMRIDAAGRVTMPYQPAFRAQLNNVNYSGSGSINPIYNYASLNVGNNYNAATGLFTAPVSGVYHFSFGLALEAAGSSGFFVIEAKVNGAISYLKFTASSVNTGIAEGGMVASATFYLSQNDTVIPAIYSSASISFGRATGGPATWWNSRNYFSGYLVG